MQIDLLNLTDEARFYLLLLIQKSANENGAVYLNQPNYPIIGPAFVLQQLNQSGHSKTKQTVNVELSHHLLIQQKQQHQTIYIIEKKPIYVNGLETTHHITGQITIDCLEEPLTVRSCQNIAKFIKKETRRPMADMITQEFQHLKRIFPSTEFFDLNKTHKEDDEVNLFKNILGIEEYCIVTKKIDGARLVELDIGQLSINQKLKIALSLIRELHQLHDPELMGGVHIHNDIRPSNIIVGPDFNAHFWEFGAATTENEPVNSLSIVYTGYDEFNKPANKSCDVYSLSITLFQLFLSPEQIPKEKNRWDVLPKGKNKQLHHNWHLNQKNTNLIGVKILEGKSKRATYKFFHHHSNVVDYGIKDLNHEQEKQLFSILKKMRHQNPISTEEAYHLLLDLSKNLEGFEKNYFSDKNFNSI